MSDWVQMFEGVRRRILVSGTALMMVEVEFAEAGNTVPTHQHIHEQVSFLLRGEMHFVVAEQERTIKAGEAILIPSNVPHSATALMPCVVIDTFSPPREDFLK
ncbi:MAG: cupin domain-containing protein [Anaerolineae bacterium]